MEMTRQKIRKHAFEAPKVGGLTRNSLMRQLGGLKVSGSKDMKESNVQAIDEVRRPPARGTITCEIRIDALMI
jgi:hypothetical protein